ncbi:LPS assembly lipoprotein LptE [Flavilitoribacter nigricans]|uniref:Lipopolysaccharide-assembly n=1 Tax=Flavilitoribacter nigricans (strain ATCC 23147 / DSM 23189 / NBRC 102662 / NCIMB 1420 / SS-2) TaxID=1122177 RepID=A0A2D0MYU5_FLAN2|nr:LPS assembly lipoprotein LptE [Flavilitoribacter nigricans]PHN01350.1 hypothetical protein CRP01_37430 [Flavilitoribacter nigricans DSM 23189 = NBRC 102662]
MFQSKPFPFIAGLLLLSMVSSCYTFSGISVDYTVMKTYYVGNFQNNALNSPPILPQTLAEALREKVRRESRLVQSDVDPDIEFVGTLVDFRVTAEAPQGGNNRESTAVNRLTIVTAIEYINYKDEEKGWKSNFSFFYDYPSNTDLSSIQDEAIEVISDQMMEDIFNKAFTDW